MRIPTRLGLAVATALATTAALAPAAPASFAAEDTHGHGNPSGTGGRHAVFVQTDNPAGNRIAAYQRGEDGTLTPDGSYDTGGLGGVLEGSVADHLASQGSLTYDPRHQRLFAVNAGSDTISVFTVDGDRLELSQVIGSGGRFPVSIAVHDDLVYVLNALDGASVQGYAFGHGRLIRMADWHRGLGLDPNAAPQFTHTPGQVGFTDDGSQLVVTTKANGSSLVVFGIAPSGAPASAPVVTADPGGVPFGFVTGGHRRLQVTEAGPNALATFTVGADGAATRTTAAATGQTATCWVTATGDFLYASNAGSSTLSGFRLDRQGRPVLIGTTPTHPGTVDSAASADGRFLYVQTGIEGIVDEFRVDDAGSLTVLGSQTVPGAIGGEGIVAF